MALEILGSSRAPGGSAAESHSESYAEILGRAGLAELDGWGKGARDPAAVGDHALQAHGAVFAEVKVDPDLGQVRATRLVHAFAAGRIINLRLVRNQLHGGMIWGVSFALHEGASMGRRSGRIMNADLGEYHVPVNADAPSLEALVHEDDAYVNGLGVKALARSASLEQWAPSKTPFGTRRGRGFASFP